WASAAPSIILKELLRATRRAREVFRVEIRIDVQVAVFEPVPDSGALLEVLRLWTGYEARHLLADFLLKPLNVGFHIIPARASFTSRCEQSLLSVLRAFGSRPLSLIRVPTKPAALNLLIPRSFCSLSIRARPFSRTSEERPPTS